jgi:6-hydroxytryprostatin B O-methyltransferase
VAAVIGKQYPSVTIISQDLPEVIKQAQLAPSTLPPNVSLAAHDFFEPQSVPAAAYLFRLILHCWSDASCRRILGSLLPVMRHGTRLIIMDLVMKAPGTQPAWLEQQRRREALVMNVLYNGAERDLPEWKELVESVDKKFVFQKVAQPEGSILGILEWIWVDE